MTQFAAGDPALGGHRTEAQRAFDDAVTSAVDQALSFLRAGNDAAAMAAIDDNLISDRRATARARLRRATIDITAPKNPRRLAGEAKTILGTRGHHRLAFEGLRVTCQDCGGTARAARLWSRWQLVGPTPPARDLTSLARCARTR